MRGLQRSFDIFPTKMYRNGQFSSHQNARLPLTSRQNARLQFTFRQNARLQFTSRQNARLRFTSRQNVQHVVVPITKVTSSVLARGSLRKQSKHPTLLFQRLYILSFFPLSSISQTANSNNFNISLQVNVQSWYSS